MRPVCLARLTGEAFKDARDAWQLERAGLGDDQIASDAGGGHTASASQLS